MQTEHCISHHRSLVRAQMPSYTGSPTLFCLLTRDPLNPLDTSANAQPYNSKNSKTTHYVSNIRSVTTTLERTVWQEKMDFLSQQTLHELYNLWTANNFVTTSLSKVLNLEENWIHTLFSFPLGSKPFFWTTYFKIHSTHPLFPLLSNAPWSEPIQRATQGTHLSFSQSKHLFEKRRGCAMLKKTYFQRQNIENSGLPRYHTQKDT